MRSVTPTNGPTYTFVNSRGRYACDLDEHDDVPDSSDFDDDDRRRYVCVTHRKAVAQAPAPVLTQQTSHEPISHDSCLSPVPYAIDDDIGPTQLIEDSDDEEDGPLAPPSAVQSLADEMGFVNAVTVAQNEAQYTAREVHSACTARDLIRVLGYPSPRRVIEMIVAGTIINCPVTAKDVSRAYKIYGPDVGARRGKRCIRVLAVRLIAYFPRGR